MQTDAKIFHQPPHSNQGIILYDSLALMSYKSCSYPDNLRRSKITTEGTVELSKIRLPSLVLSNFKELQVHISQATYQ